MPHESDRKAVVELPQDVEEGLYPSKLENWPPFIKKENEQALEIRKRYETIWAISLAYYKGYQNILFDASTGIFQLERESYQPFITNRIAAFIESRHAKVTKNRPTVIVQPNSADREDRIAARFGEHALKFLWRKIDMESMYDRLLMQMFICGTSFGDTRWDPNAGDAMIVDKFDVGDIMDFDSQERIFEGEILTEPLSAFNLLPANDQIMNIRDQPWIIKRTFQPIAHIENLYPHLRGQIKPDRDDHLTRAERMVQRISSPIANVTGSTQEIIEDGARQVLTTEWLMKPNAQYRKGLIIVYLSDQIAMLTEFPDDYGKNIYPIVKFAEKEDGFSFWSQSTIERLIPVQRALNLLRQKKIRNFSLMAAGKWLIPKGSQIPDDAISDEEGEIIDYNPSLPKPEQARISPLPNYVETLNHDLITDFRDVGGQRETTFNPGPNLTAGIAIQVQSELTDEILSPLIKRIGRGMELIAGQQLILMQQNWKEPRKIRIIGESGENIVAEMSEADFRNHTDVALEVDSLFPDFRGAKKQMLFDLWDRRIITDPKQLIRMIRFGDFNMLMEEQEKLEDRIVADIGLIKRGIPPEVHQDGQNHLEYVLQLSKWMNTPDWMKLAEERKVLSKDIFKAHLQFIQTPAPQAEQNQAAVGTPQGPVIPAA